MQIFYYNLITCYLQLREFEKGRVIIERCQTLVEPGSFNWFKLQELFFLLAMHTAHYEAAAQVLEQVMDDPRFENQSFQITEVWKIYQAYVHFLIKVGKLPLSASPSSQRNSKFKLGKFLNETPVFSKDKRGMNIPILIVQILYALPVSHPPKIPHRSCNRYWILSPQIAIDEGCVLHIIGIKEVKMQTC